VNKLRWGKFYWSDWSDDPALASCSLAAQGLWMRLLCIAAQGTPYGHVTINGKAPDTPTLAKLMRCKQPSLERLIAELERKGVAKRGDCGCLVSFRMESDGSLARARASAAKSRWDKGLGPDLHMQTESFASTEAEADAEAEVRGHPLPTPKKEPSKPPAAREASVIHFMAKKRDGDDGA
jgi:hypothetical protein